MNKKRRAILTEDQCIQRYANSILSSTILTKTVQSTQFDTAPSNSQNLTTNIQGTTIKTDINEWQVYLANEASPFAVTTNNLLDQKRFRVSPPNIYTTFQRTIFRIHHKRSTAFLLYLS